MAVGAAVVSKYILNLITQQEPIMQATAMETRKTYTGRALQAMDLLAQGMGETIVAEAMGVSIGLISQFMSEESFAEQVQARKAARFGKQLETDKYIDDIELKATKRLASMVEWVTDTDKLLRLAAFANDAKRKTVPNGPAAMQGGTNIVQLILPPCIKQVYTTNAQNEVIALDGQQMLPIQAKELDAALQSRELSKRKLTAEDISHVTQL